MIDLSIVQDIKDGDFSNSYIILNENMDYVIWMCKQLGVRVNHYDDFKQLSWLALVEAAKAYDFKFSKRNTFKILWFRYVMKNYLDLKRRQDYAMVVARATYTKLKNTIGIENSKLCLISFEKTFDCTCDGMLFNVEYTVLRKMLWDEVKCCLDRIDYLIICKYYRSCETMQSIADSLSMELCDVRKRKNRALRVLRNSEYLQELAKEFYLID